MSRTLGIFSEREHAADFLWSQCDGGPGIIGDVEIRQSDRTADHALVITTPAPPQGVPDARRGKLSSWRRRLGKLAGRSPAAMKAEAGFRWIGRARETTSVLFYEPPPIIPDDLYAVARRFAARVYGPDPRATHPTCLPAFWTFHDDIAALRDMPPPTAKPVALGAVSSGKQMIAGHGERLDFFRALRRAGQPLDLFGRGLPADLGSRGLLDSKASILRHARLTLAIENYAEGDLYVTEKLWDPLVCWSLPLYHGSRAPDAMIPTDAFVRLPDLGGAGIETVRRALADPALWKRRLDAIAEARRRILGDLRLLEWARREFFSPIVIAPARAPAPAPPPLTATAPENAAAPTTA